jgi:hypothetical protein
MLAVPLARAAVICGAEAYPFGPEAASPAFVRCEIMARCFSLSAAQKVLE